MHTTLLKYYCNHSRSWRSYFCKNIGYVWIFCVLVMRSCVIWPICGLIN